MKKTFIRLSVIALMIGLISCGGRQKELTKSIPASAVKITGDCSNFFTISDESVKILLTKVEEREYGWEVRAVVPLAKTTEAKSWSELKALPHIEKPYFDGMFGFSGCSSKAKYLDANGTEIDLNLKMVGIDELLKSDHMSPEIIAIQYDWNSNSSNYEKSKAKYDKVAGIKLIINLDFDEQFINEKPAPKKSATSKKNNWDSLLNEYENYVDQYIKFYKKAMNGDMSAMNEYMDLLEKAQEISEQLNTEQNNMTTTQMNRYLKITNKMSNAMLDL